MKKTDDPRQTSFNFYASSQAPTLGNGSTTKLSDFDFELRKLLKKILSDHKGSRANLAKQMTVLLGREITKHHIDGWVAMSSIERRIHTDALKAICDITKDYRLIHFLAESCGYKALSHEEAEFADYGAKVFFKKMLDKDLKAAFKSSNKAQLAEKLKQRAIRNGGWKP